MRGQCWWPARSCCAPPSRRPHSACAWATALWRAFSLWTRRASSAATAMNIWKNWPVKPAGSWNVFGWRRGKKMRSGAIDVFGPRVRHGANDKANNFPLLNAGVLWTELLAREDDARVVLGQLPAQLSVGILAASHGKDEWLAHEDGSEKALDAWAEQAGITIHTRVFQTVEAMRTAFFSGAVDTMLGSSLHKHEHVNILARFAARPFYFVPAPARADILQAINAVQAEHAYADPYFTARLREKHYWYNVAHPVTFSRAERAALSAHPSLRVIFLNALPP